MTQVILRKLIPRSFRPVWNRDIGGHANEQLMQGEALGPESDQLPVVQAREIAQLPGAIDIGENILRPEYRAERTQPIGNLRLQPRIPGTERGIALESRIHQRNESER